MNLLKQILLMTLVATVVVVFSNIPTIRAAFNNSPRVWAGAFESNPTGTDSISLGDDHIRQVKAETRGRLETEHTFGAIVDAADDGRHREGAARAFFVDVEPTAISVEDYFNGVTGVADDALDEGRLWRDSDVDNGTFRIFNGTSFVEAVTALSGDPDNSNLINLIAPVQFEKDAADPMDLHAHAVRHITDGADRILNLIEGVARGYNLLEVDHSGALPKTMISASIDFTGRGGLSHVLLIGSAYVRSQFGQAETDFQIFDSVDGALVGSIFKARTGGGFAETYSGFVMIEQTAVTAAPHVWTLELISTTGGSETSHFVGNRLIFVIDLGRE